MKKKIVPKILIIVSFIILVYSIVIDFNLDERTDELNLSSTNISKIEKKIIVRIIEELKSEKKISSSKSIQKFELIGTSDYTNKLISNSTLNNNENGQDVVEITLIDVTENNKKRVIAQFSLRDKKTNNVRFEKSTYL